MYRDDGSVRQLYHEYGFSLRARRGVDCQHDFEDVRIEVASLDVDIDFDFGLSRWLNQALRRPRVFERQILDVLRVEDQLLRARGGSRLRCAVSAVACRLIRHEALLDA